MSIKVGANTTGFSGHVCLDRKLTEGVLHFEEDVVQFLRSPVIVNDFRQPTSHLCKFTILEIRFIDGRVRLRFHNQIVGHDAFDVLVAILAETARRAVSRINR